MGEFVIPIVVATLFCHFGNQNRENYENRENPNFTKNAN